MATFKRSGNCPVEMLILIIFNSEGLTISADFFKILGVIPSSPVALVASSGPMIDIRSVFFINGIVNLILSGTFALT